MSTSIRWLFALALPVGLWGCASGSGGPARDRNVISPEEIEAAQVRTAYELVERLRPLWLRSRGDRSTHLTTEIVVYQDNTMLGDIEMLRSIPIDLVGSVRSLDSAEAGRLAGLGSRHVERVIMIVTKPNKPGINDG
ncbi:MAG TPA: hypothetical protein VLH75_19605 [Longimicrobiales bacterium]|nr:hypothetical protein [Longimicrobiales bacterium]